jgi:DNA invertase Pin-like site-specific DNA recombinase
MLKACRRGSVDVVVVWKFDRFARLILALHPAVLHSTRPLSHNAATREIRVTVLEVVGKLLLSPLL